MGCPPYHEAVRLLAAAAVNWTAFDSRSIEAGIDPFALSFRRLLNFIDGVFRQALATEEAKLRQYEEMLSRPLPWQMERVPQSVIDQEMEMFNRAAHS